MTIARVKKDTTDGSVKEISSPVCHEIEKKLFSQNSKDNESDVGRE